MGSSTCHIHRRPPFPCPTAGLAAGDKFLGPLTPPPRLCPSQPGSFLLRRLCSTERDLDHYRMTEMPTVGGEWREGRAWGLQAWVGGVR